jgi:hypothetical protein
LSERNYFQVLYDIDVKDKIEQKNGLNYLSWAAAWAEVKKVYPASTFKIYERESGEGYLINYFTDGRTCWVKTGVTVNGIEHIEELPVMDFKNKSIKLEDVTSCEVNKSIQRSLTKALARHGLGLYIYEGEDMPESTAKAENEIKEINEESLAIATEKAKKSEELKKAVGELIMEYNPKKNVMAIKNIDKAKELNARLKEIK